MTEMIEGLFFLGGEGGAVEIFESKIFLFGKFGNFFLGDLLSRDFFGRVVLRIK